MALMSGTLQQYAARAMTSALKTQRSSRLPPPGPNDLIHFPALVQPPDGVGDLLRGLKALHADRAGNSLLPASVG